MKILLVEDHQEIAGVIFDFFEMHGHILDHAINGPQGLKLASEHHYDVIILDIMLPQLDGLSVCKLLRETGIDTPILMLTARDDNDDVLHGFNAGADDYLIKPFDLNILAARLNALHNRKLGVMAKKELAFSSLTLSLTNHTLHRHDCQFKLNQTLFVIIKLMMLKAPEPITREEIIHELWQDNEPDEDVLRHHIYQLRSLIDKPFNHKFIKTIPKVGYQLIEQP